MHGEWLIMSGLTLDSTLFWCYFTDPKTERIMRSSNARLTAQLCQVSARPEPSLQLAS